MSFKNLWCDWEICAPMRCKTSLILSKSFKSFIASELFQLTVLPVTVLPRALDKSELPKSLSWTSIMYRHLEAVSKRPINLRHFKALTDHTTIILSLVVPCAQFLSFFLVYVPYGQSCSQAFCCSKAGSCLTPAPNGLWIVPIVSHISIISLHMSWPWKPWYIAILQSYWYCCELCPGQFLRSWPRRGRVPIGSPIARASRQIFQSNRA